MSSLVRLAFIGTGSWARRYHFRALQHIRQNKPEALGGRELVLHGIYGLRQDEAADLAGRYGFGRVYATLDELIADAEVDVVALAITPTATKEVVLKLMAKNVPIFTEKPPGISYAEAQELAKRVHVPNVVAFNRRYGLLNNRFKEMLAQHPGIGNVRGLMYRKNRSEPDFIRTTAVHVINFMEYLFGSIRTLRNERTVEASTGGPVYHAHVRFESGLPGELVVSPCSARHWEGMEVYPEQPGGQILILHSPHNDEPGEILTRQSGESAGEATVLGRSQDIPLLEEGYVWEYLDLLSSAVGGPPARSTFQNATNTIRVAEAIDTAQDLP